MQVQLSSCSSPSTLVLPGWLLQGGGPTLDLAPFLELADLLYRSAMRLNVFRSTYRTDRGKNAGPAKDSSLRPRCAKLSNFSVPRQGEVSRIYLPGSRVNRGQESAEGPRNAEKAS